MEFILYREGRCASVVLEESAYSGVRRIAGKVCRDAELVTNVRPALETVRGTSSVVLAESARKTGTNSVVFAATIGRSPILEQLAEAGAIDLSPLRGKRECFSFGFAELGDGTKKVSVLVIAGSDKRGTIYGLFHISELMGVSPFVSFADVLPAKRDAVVFTEADAMVSKEPSVKYRGFFINDEWPAFGNWTFEHFGGFTAEMYDLIFETLLRLKGNYLWPAMWTSSFTLDGPGEANAKLADEYGVVMSNSHHEPCLRHSEEWDKVRGEDSVYGNEWNYYTNREGLLRYWEDGLKRSGKYENIITIGMRGERDSSMLGPDASLKQNIDLLKDIITEQRRLIAEHVEADGRKAPQMLALYKEVEAYFYGNPGAHDGLRDWDGLDGVTFMLCEDNFGNMRTLPTEDLKDREGGWGMYYHFDYHGGPISYEWVNSSYLPKVWDQMTKAYEFGIRDIWIVNVGDLKFNEYPLSFFMDLAYDYDRWGVGNPNAAKEYLDGWVKREFGHCLSAEDCGKLARVMKDYTKLNHNRKPEVMRPDVYHPTHGNEAGRMLEQIAKTDCMLEELKQQIPKEAEASFWELVYYPAKGSLNVQRWNLLAGLNRFYAGLGAVYANECADGMRACYETDRRLTETFHGLLDGKWNGMGLSRHVGFVSWNDEGCRYPVEMRVTPVEGERLFAYAEGDGDVVSAGGDWTGRVLVMDRFLRPDVTEAALILVNAGSKAAEYEVVCDLPWLAFSARKGRVESLEKLVVRLDRDAWAKRAPEESGQPGGADFVVKYAGGRIKVRVEAAQNETWSGKGLTFLEVRGIVSIEAEHYAGKTDSTQGEFVRLDEYGRTLSGMKPMPVNRVFAPDDAPGLTYQIWVSDPGSYRLMLYVAPVNPHQADADVACRVAVNDGERMTVSLIPENYGAGENWCPSWCKMALEQIRIVMAEVVLEKGLNRVLVEAADPGFLPEKLVFVREGRTLPETYLGPEESYYREC